MRSLCVLAAVLAVSAQWPAVAGSGARESSDSDGFRLDDMGRPMPLNADAGEVRAASGPRARIIRTISRLTFDFARRVQAQQVDVVEQAESPKQKVGRAACEPRCGVLGPGWAAGRAAVAVRRAWLTRGCSRADGGAG